MKHIHAELMLQYAQDAMETDKPWERWEYFDTQVWRPLRMVYPLWSVNTQYRRKPMTININGHEVPEPYRGEMRYEQFYYIPSLDSNDFWYELCWTKDFVDQSAMERGLLHLTKEAAIKHAEALLSFTEL